MVSDNNTIIIVNSRFHNNFSGSKIIYITVHFSSFHDVKTAKVKTAPNVFL